MANTKSIEKGHYYCSPCADRLVGFMIFKCALLSSEEEVGMLNGRSEMSHFLYKFQSEPRVLGRMYLGSDSSELAAEKGLTYGSCHKGQLYYKICFIPL